VDGNIGYKAAGLTPRRTTWDGLLPVPGDGRHEWDGFIDMYQLPTEFNPARGFAGTANSMNLPGTYDINRYRLGFEWSAPWRYNRLWQVLSGDDKHSLDASTSMQRDYHELLADEVLKRIPDLKSLGTAGKLLFRWNRVLDRDSAPAALWAVWFYHHLTPAITRAIGGEHAALLEPLDPWTVIDALDGRFPQIDVRSILNSSLSAAWAACEQKLGADPSRWQWGGLHRTTFVHPLHTHADPELQQKLSLPSLPRGGSTNTLNNTTFGNADFLVRSGASWRMVLDVGNWDAARMTNAPGQSGDPRSPFYGNLLEGWANDRDFPLLWSDTAIDAHTVHIIELTPVSSD
jgi:penicillin amidase